MSDKLPDVVRLSRDYQWESQTNMQSNEIMLWQEWFNGASLVRQSDHMRAVPVVSPSCATSGNLSRGMVQPRPLPRSATYLRGRGEPRGVTCVPVLDGLRKWWFTGERNERPLAVARRPPIEERGALAAECPCLSRVFFSPSFCQNFLDCLSSGPPRPLSQAGRFRFVMATAAGRPYSHVGGCRRVSIYHLLTLQTSLCPAGAGWSRDQGESRWLASLQASLHRRVTAAGPLAAV